MTQNPPHQEDLTVNSTNDGSSNESKTERTDVNRRRYLKSVGAIGTGSIIGIESFSTAVGAVGDSVEIVILAQGDEAKQTVMVDNSWYQHTKNAENAKIKIREQLKSRSDLRSIGIGIGDRNIGGLRSSTIIVGISENGSKTGIPSEVDNIPVIVEKQPKAEGGCYTGKKAKIYGGIGCYETTNGGNCYGTLCCRVFKSGNEYILTARHLYENCGNLCETDYNPVGDVLYQGQDSPVGRVQYQYHNADIVLVDRSLTSRSFSDTIVDESGSVVGRVANDGLHYLKSNNSTVRKRGRTTCATQGTIKRIQQEYFCSTYYIGGLVRSTPTFKHGDSGGPVYYKKSSSSSNIWIVNIDNILTNDGTYDGKGSSANYMYNKHGITWGGNPYHGG